MTVPRSLIIGIGGAGLAVISQIYATPNLRPRTMAVDSDPGALYFARAAHKFLLNKGKSCACGAIASPLMRLCDAESDIERISSAVNQDLVVLISGFGGATGTALTPIFAREARAQGALVITLALTPFPNEGDLCYLRACRGLETTLMFSDTVIPLSNQMLEVIHSQILLRERIMLFDQYIAQVARGIVEMVSRWGRINLDLADVRAVLSKQDGMVGFIRACEVSLRESVVLKLSKVMQNPLDPGQADRVTNAVISIAGPSSTSLRQIDEIVSAIASELADDASIKFGVLLDPALKDRVRITIIGSQEE